MSNHNGSYIINNILWLLDENKVFDFLGTEKTLKFLSDVRGIGYCNDCNNGEMLDEIGVKLGVCYTCWEYVSGLPEDGICKSCDARYFKH